MVTVDIHICNLLSVIIRYVQRMKQAHVHVFIFTELSMLNAVLAALCFIKY